MALRIEAACYLINKRFSSCSAVVYVPFFVFVRMRRKREYAPEKRVRRDISNDVRQNKNLSVSRL